MTPEQDHHDSAVVLIIEAAKRSGLLRRVAVALNANAGCCDSDCVACSVLEDLTDELSDLRLSTTEGFAPATDAELDPVSQSEKDGVDGADPNSWR